MSEKAISKTTDMDWIPGKYMKGGRITKMGGCIMKMGGCIMKMDGCIMKMDGFIKEFYRI